MLPGVPGASPGVAGFGAMGAIVAAVYGADVEKAGGGEIWGVCASGVPGAVPAWPLVNPWLVMGLASAAGVEAAVFGDVIAAGAAEAVTGVGRGTCVC
jgi:hypothetical protein